MTLDGDGRVAAKGRSRTATTNVAPRGRRFVAFAARAAGRILADLEVGHGRRARCECGAGGPEATACTVLFAEACARWPSVIFRAPEACLVPARVRDCSARGLVGIGTTVPGRSVTSSARDRRTVKSYLDMQVCLAYSYGPSSMSGLSDCSSLSAMVRRGVELAHGS